MTQDSRHSTETKTIYKITPLAHHTSPSRLSKASTIASRETPSRWKPDCDTYTQLFLGEVPGGLGRIGLRFPELDCGRWLVHEVNQQQGSQRGHHQHHHTARRLLFTPGSAGRGRIISQTTSTATLQTSQKYDSIVVYSIHSSSTWYTGSRSRMKARPRHQEETRVYRLHSPTAG